MPPDRVRGPAGLALIRNDLGPHDSPCSRLRRGRLCDPSQNGHSVRTIGTLRPGEGTRVDPAIVPSALVDRTGALVTRRPAVPGA